jgi:EAL domain-containing protein (putative c-di-GMP-specific phosphodiesterase class I)
MMNPGDQAIAGAIITMAHGMKLKVVAEGVETEAQMGFLRANHCDEIQGYLVSYPLPPNRLGALLRSNNGQWPLA